MQISTLLMMLDLFLIYVLIKTALCFVLTFCQQKTKAPTCGARSYIQNDF